MDPVSESFATWGGAVTVTFGEAMVSGLSDPFDEPIEISGGAVFTEDEVGGGGARDVVEIARRVQDLDAAEQAGVTEEDYYKSLIVPLSDTPKRDFRGGLARLMDTITF